MVYKAKADCLKGWLIKGQDEQCSGVARTGFSREELSMIEAI
ncbi:hypothetical protein ABE208_14540 [Bacillus inaquosorum]|nr:hypothetical protein [Bacillus inaquosorum]